MGSFVQFNWVIIGHLVDHWPIRVKKLLNFYYLFIIYQNVIDLLFFINFIDQSFPNFYSQIFLYYFIINIIDLQSSISLTFLSFLLLITTNIKNYYLPLIFGSIFLFILIMMGGNLLINFICLFNEVACFNFLC